MNRYRLSILILTLFVFLSLALTACAPAQPAEPTPVEVPTQELASVPAPANPDLILATTTSTQDSGLLDVLIPLFEQQTGYFVKTVAVGTGQALKLGEEGNADVLLVHAPSSEKTFMENGFGKDRFLVMHNDFILVGPAADPAGIKSTTTATEAFQKMAAFAATFISRGDDSGTNQTELKLWQTANIDPQGQAWYLETGQGMSATLQITSEKAAYTLTDRATYLANKNNLQMVPETSSGMVPETSYRMDVLFEGDPALLNVYHVITVNPDKWPKVNYDGALDFAKFITNPATQKLIGEFGKEEFGQPLFIPEASSGTFPDADKTDADLGL